MMDRIAMFSQKRLPPHHRGDWVWGGMDTNYRRRNKKLPDLDSINEEEKSVATYLAMAVRNAMEGFHTEHLTDKQMKELNPIVRNAIFTGLHSMRMKTNSSMVSRSSGYAESVRGSSVDRRDGETLRVRVRSDNSR